MQIRAIYKKNILKPLDKLYLKENSKVRLTIKKSFYELLDDLGEIEAKDDIEKVLKEVRVKKYYG